MGLDVSRALDGAVLKLTLNQPKGNVLDGKLIAELRAQIAAAKKDASLRAVLVDAAGKDFSWGASVEEHRPEQCAGMLAALHGLVVEMLELPLPVLVAVQGRCLGGGLELALAGSRLFAHPGATFGQPEIKLGVFAPAASALLAERVGAPAAEDLLVTGRTANAEEALKLKLVDELCATDSTPADAALAYAKAHLLETSRTALRYATRAARMFRVAAVKERLAALEHFYVDDLMKSADAKEGIASFLEKRSPKWTHALPT
jgi:cyclohexa-1,5-dienecarbonyl-CoA hydratase